MSERARLKNRIAISAQPSKAAAPVKSIGVPVSAVQERHDQSTCETAEKADAPHSELRVICQEVAPGQFNHHQATQHESGVVSRPGDQDRPSREHPMATHFTCATDNDATSAWRQYHAAERPLLNPPEVACNNVGSTKPGVF